MDAHEVFYAQTQSTINFLYAVVMCLLPMLWFGDCKRAISLLFKKIKIPSTEEENQFEFEFTQNLQIIVILFGIAMYYLHRRWRLGLQETRTNMLKDEASFTETFELHNLKVKLLDKINRIIEENIILPLKYYTSGTKPERTLSGFSFKSFLVPSQMQDLTEENRESYKQFSDFEKDFGKEKKTPGENKRTSQRRVLSPR